MDFKFGQYIQRVHPNKSPLKILDKREHGCMHGLPIFSGTPYYLRNGKSYGFQIWQVQSEGPSEQKAIKILEKRECGHIQGLPIFRVLPIISGMGKATDFKYGRYIHRVHSNKRPLKFWRKGSMGISRDQSFKYPLLSQERIQLQTSNFVRTFIGSIGTKAR